MTKKHNLTEFIQIRVNVKEKAFIQLLAKKHSNKGVSVFIMNILYNELSRASLFDAEINEAREELMKG